jgi:hypothetical protein
MNRPSGCCLRNFTPQSARSRSSFHRARSAGVDARRSDRDRYVGPRSNRGMSIHRHERRRSCVKSVLPSPFGTLIVGHVSNSPLVEAEVERATARLPHPLGPPLPRRDGGDPRRSEPLSPRERGWGEGQRQRDAATDLFENRRRPQNPTTWTGAWLLFNVPSPSCPVAL